MMDEVTKILWSGLTGRTGVEAIKEAAKLKDVEIVAGIRREICGGIDYEGAIDFNERAGYAGKWYRYRDLNNITRPQPEGFDIIVDFSDASCFDQVVEKAVRTHVPLISGTSGLSDDQMAKLYLAANQIPVFRGGNFRFKVKKFIDETVEFAKNEKGHLDLYENFWKGMILPSETSKVIRRRISNETGRTIEVHSSDTFDEGNWICDWELQVHRRVSPTAMHQNKVHCRVIGFDELAHDVLEIAKVMKNKPVRKGELYDLDEIWGDIPEEAKAVTM